MNTQIEMLKQKVFKIPDSGNERSFYPALCNFFEEYGKVTLKLRALQAISEESLSKDDKNIGFPDITIRNGQSLIGWVEVKLPEDELGSDKFKLQFGKYKDSLENIIFTNLREWELWQWVKDEGESKIESRQIAKASFDVTNISGADSAEFENFLARFFEGRAHETRTPKQLALALAKKTRLLSKQVEEALETADEKSDLWKLKETFEKTLIQDISSHQFSNMVAETMAYSLFLSALEHERRGNGTELTLTNAIDYLPTNVPILADLYDLIKKIASAIPNIYESAQLLVDQLNASEIERIRQKLVEHKPGEDPVIQFYEPFLAEYDPKEREARGVYYTPKPVVDYIVRSVDWILRNKFGKEKGLADESVNLLDPATGTGTFLMSAIQEIYWNTKKANEALGDEMVSREFNKIVLNHILKHFYGFELLIAPYAVAHLKLTLEIERLGFDFKLSKGDGDMENGRFKIYLANTLDDPNKPPQKLFGFDSIPAESEKAQKVKRDLPILAIIGNPPYSKITSNLSEYMRGLVEPYKYVDGQKIKERGALQLEINLNDDYVKFIGFAQRQISNNPEGGVVALITNHNYLDNPTLYGMRNNLASTFSEIYIFDLKGNLQKAKGGRRKIDENVFNIQQGVCITFFIKNEKKTKVGFAKVFYRSIEGKREDKFDYLISNSISSDKFEEIHPKTPHYFFVSRDETFDAEYNQFEKLTDIFPLNSAGIITARDSLALADSEKELLSKIDIYKNSLKSNQELADDLGINVKKGWDMDKSRSDVRKLTNLSSFVKDILYRPFSTKKIFYHPAITWSMSQPMTTQFSKPNIGLVFTRQVTGLNWAHIQVTDKSIEIKSNSHDRSSQFAPLYIYTEAQNSLLPSAASRVTNIPQRILNDISARLKLSIITVGRGDLEKTLGPEDILYYAYAIFHSLTYRARYAEQLKIDFPRLPITSDKDLFKRLVAFGNELVNLHLLGENPFDSSKTILDDPNKWNIKIGGVCPANLEEWKVTDVHYNEKEKRVYVNAGQYFESVEKGVWEFMIGGYQVCEKWLKDRKKAGRSLSTDDLKHYMKIIVSLRETIRLMKEIDAAIPDWPIK